MYETSNDESTIIACVEQKSISSNDPFVYKNGLK